MSSKLTPEDLQNSSEFELLAEVSHQKLREFVVEQIREEKHIIRIYSIYQVIMMLIFVYFLTRGIVLAIKGHPELISTIGLAILFSFSVLIVFHELLHALAYLLTGARKISFGVILKKFIFYALPTVKSFPTSLSRGGTGPAGTGQTDLSGWNVAILEQSADVFFPERDVPAFAVLCRRCGHARLL